MNTPSGDDRAYTSMLVVCEERAYLEARSTEKTPAPPVFRGVGGWGGGAVLASRIEGGSFFGRAKIALRKTRRCVVFSTEQNKMHTAVPHCITQANHDAGGRRDGDDDGHRE